MPLEATNICFGYKNTNLVISDFSLSIYPGEIVGLVGKSGQGKTTLARILAGHLMANKGIVTVSGQRLPSHGFRPVQLVFQHPERAINPRWKMKRVLEESGALDEEALEEVGIDHSWLNRFPNELSGGELQRFCVARALAPKTRYLIGDEMTTMLDAITQAQIWHAVLRRVQQCRLGLLVISHELSLVNRLCSRVVKLH